MVGAQNAMLVCYSWVLLRECEVAGVVEEVVMVVVMGFAVLDESLPWGWSCLRSIVMKDLKSLADTLRFSSGLALCCMAPSFRRDVLFGGLRRNVSAAVWLRSSLGKEMDQSLLLRGCLVRLKPSWVAPVRGGHAR